MSDRRMPIRKRQVNLIGDFDGWFFTGILNPPLRVIEDLTSGETSKLATGIARVVAAPWNFVDEFGKDLPEPSLEVIRDLPIDLIEAIAKAYMEEQGKLPPT
jgi:hypothetical protein